MIPAYRGEDDKSSSSVRRNVESLNVAGRIWPRDCRWAFFEGKSHDLVHVEQVKTGAARIAQRAYEMSDGDEPIWIVPLGLNFEDKTRFGVVSGCPSRKRSMPPPGLRSIKERKNWRCVN